MLDHGQDLAGVAVLNDGDVAVAFAHRGLINQQHPTTTAAAMLGHQRRPRRDQVLDQMPVKAMAAHHRANRHDLGISDELASQPPSQTAFEHDMVLQVTFVAVGTHEPTPDPHQRHTPPAHRQIPDLAPTPIMHRTALETTEQTTRPRPSRRHLNLETRWRINQHSEHANETQVQPHPHSVNSPCGGTLNRPPPHAYAQAPFSRRPTGFQGVSGGGGTPEAPRRIRSPREVDHPFSRCCRYDPCVPVASGRVLEQPRIGPGLSAARYGGRH